MFDTTKMYDVLTSCTVVGGALGGAGAVYQAGFTGVDMTMLKGAGMGALVAYVAHEIDRQLASSGTITSMWPTEQTMCYVPGAIFGFGGTYWGIRNTSFI